MIHLKLWQYIKTGLLIFFLFVNGRAFGQTFSGQVLSDETKTGLGYVNIGIIGRNIGTVANQSGNFSIDLDNSYNNDSLRFSMIGYESKVFLVKTFKENSINTIYLSPKSYYLTEVKVIYQKVRKKMLGMPVTSDSLKSGFATNNLGSELGIKVFTRGRVQLEDINLNVATCTYDSVTYRLNIYQIINESEYKNILTTPIYISFSKDKVKDVLTFDLRKYSLIVEGNILITLELYKDLGEGKLLFYTTFFTGFTYHKKTSEGKWSKAPGIVGIYLHGLLIKENSYGSKKL
jgi:hypothetical protein